jgi:hypothetical protein
LFLVDAACHPGMEGGLIRCRCAGVTETLPGEGL